MVNKTFGPHMSTPYIHWLVKILTYRNPVLRNATSFAFVLYLSQMLENISLALRGMREWNDLDDTIHLLVQMATFAS